MLHKQSLLRYCYNQGDFDYETINQFQASNVQVYQYRCTIVYLSAHWLHNLSVNSTSARSDVISGSVFILGSIEAHHSVSFSQYRRSISFFYMVLCADILLDQFGRFDYYHGFGSRSSQSRTINTDDKQFGEMLVRPI